MKKVCCEDREKNMEKVETVEQESGKISKDEVKKTFEQDEEWKG